MALVSTDRLNVFWTEGVLPLKQNFLLLQNEVNDLKANGYSGNQSDTPISVQGVGVVYAYIRKNGEEFTSTWLGENPTAQPLTPQEKIIYVIVSDGSYTNRMFRWDATEEEYVPLLAEEDITEEDIEEIINKYVIPTVDIEDGFSPIITEDENNNANVYKLNITTKAGTFTTVNLIGNTNVTSKLSVGTVDGHLYFNGHKLMFSNDVSEEVVDVEAMIAEALTVLNAVEENENNNENNEETGGNGDNGEVENPTQTEEPTEPQTPDEPQGPQEPEEPNEPEG